MIVVFILSVVMVYLIVVVVLCNLVFSDVGGIMFVIFWIIKSLFGFVEKIVLGFIWLL